MSDTTPEVRMQQIKLRRAEIFAALAAARHHWVTTGEPRPLHERTGLEAEDAALALELLQIGHQSVQAKVARRQALNDGFLTALLKELHERGMWDVADTAAESVRFDLDAITPWRTRQGAAS